MASISDDPNGRRRILFVAPDGSRKTTVASGYHRRTVDAASRHDDLRCLRLRQSQFQAKLGIL